MGILSHECCNDATHHSSYTLEEVGNTEEVLRTVIDVFSLLNYQYSIDRHISESHGETGSE